MGKTAKPCSILAMDATLYDSTEMQALKAKGHVILATSDVQQADTFDFSLIDVIIGPQCWRVDPALGNLEAILEMVLKGVRARKYVGKRAAK